MRRGTRSAQALARKIGEEAATPRLARSLTARGMCPQKSLPEKTGRERAHFRGTNVPQRKGVGRERKLVATATAAKSEAWEHPTADSGCGNDCPNLRELSLVPFSPNDLAFNCVCIALWSKQFAVRLFAA